MKLLSLMRRFYLKLPLCTKLTRSSLIQHQRSANCKIKKELQLWALRDDCLLADVQNERETMDAIYEAIKTDCNTITHWFYGHFHQSWHSTINGVLFKMLDIMELIELTP